MSFGSNIKSKDLSGKLISIFVNVFKTIKYDVVWKFEDESLLKKRKYIHTQKWLPQADLLAHPKIKLFITQGGQQSVEEAIDRAVPMIIIPFLGDQPGMAVKLKQKDIAQYIDFDNITHNSLSEAINEMTKPIYKENVINLRKVIYDQPMTSREKAVWWTEYVLRNKGTKHLAYPGRLVPFYQKYCLDFLFITIVLFYFILKIIELSFKFLFKSHKVKTE
ncbi:hypothetical protein PVAND_007925 [Polypedilum vanderplanki]|uniref:UDP-glucuronosyltransferase n=1 Tax=Polypedilum vanderplanki TaxID=319348 RepID=A0A9J6C839_POLVA|nr:hypothetical protein PVAND_007925 [Polypedilum vanderplanki]